MHVKNFRTPPLTSPTDEREGFEVDIAHSADTALILSPKKKSRHSRQNDMRNAMGLPTSNDSSNLAEMSAQGALEIKSASTIKAQWRQHQIIKEIRRENRQLNENGLHEIRHPESGRIVGYTDPKQQMHKAGERTTLAIWPNLEDGKFDSEIQGYTKKLSHIRNKPEFLKLYGTGYVGLTMHELVRNAGADKNFSLPDEALKKLLELNLSHVVIQRQVSPGFFVAREFEIDLFDFLHEKALPIKGFKAFLENLKTMHENDLAHRDIRPDNLLIKNDEAYLTDLDTTDFVTHLKPVWSVPGASEYRDTDLAFYLSEKIYDDLKEGTAEMGLYAKTMDNYAAILTMIVSDARCELKIRCEPPDDAIADFTPNAADLIGEWIDIHVKPEFATNICDLLENPMQYSQKHQHSPPHLIDMLSWP